jgi:hypothetical protein
VASAAAIAKRHAKRHGMGLHVLEDDDAWHPTAPTTL